MAGNFVKFEFHRRTTGNSRHPLLAKMIDVSFANYGDSALNIPA